MISEDRALEDRSDRYDHQKVAPELGFLTKRVAQSHHERKQKSHSLGEEAEFGGHFLSGVGRTGVSAPIRDQLPHEADE